MLIKISFISRALQQHRESLVDELIDKDAPIPPLERFRLENDYIAKEIFDVFNHNKLFDYLQGRIGPGENFWDVVMEIEDVIRGVLNTTAFDRIIDIKFISKYTIVIEVLHESKRPTST